MRHLAMLALLLSRLATLRSVLRVRAELALENLALRRQLAALHPSGPTIRPATPLPGWEPSIP